MEIHFVEENAYAKGYEDKSEEVQEILEKEPAWLLRFGISSLLVLLMLLIVLAAFIKYPDTIQAKVVITTPNPPISLVSHTSSEIAEIYVSEGQKVAKDTPLILFKNTADYAQVNKLNYLLDSLLAANLITDLHKHSFLFLDNLGELQNSYNSLFLSYKKYTSYLKTDSYNKQLKKLRNSLYRYSELKNVQKKKHLLQQKDLDIVVNEHKKMKELYAKGIIAQSDLQNDNRLLVRKEIEVSGSNEDIANTNISISNLQKQIMEVNIAKENYEKQLFDEITTKSRKLHSELNNWKQTYLIIALTSGKISYFQKWKNGEFIKAGTEVLSILPEENQKVIAKGLIASDGAGKVKIGQKVLLKLKNYPAKEYGIVKGVVSYISQIPKDSFYSVEIKLPNGVATNYDKHIILKQKMEADAEIVTEDLSFLQRILYQFKYLYKKSKI